MATAVADVEGKDLASRGVHRNSDPVAVCLRAHKAPELIHFGLQSLQDHCRGACRWLDVKMLGGRLEPFDHELQELAESDTHRTTDLAQRDAFE